MDIKTQIIGIGNNSKNIIKQIKSIDNYYSFLFQNSDKAYVFYQYKISNRNALYRCCLYHDDCLEILKHISKSNFDKFVIIADASEVEIISDFIDLLHRCRKKFSILVFNAYQENKESAIKCLKLLGENITVVNQEDYQPLSLIDEEKANNFMYQHIKKIISFFV